MTRLHRLTPWVHWLPELLALAAWFAAIYLNLHV